MPYPPILGVKPKPLYYLTVMLDIDGTLFARAPDQAEDSILSAQAHMTLASECLYGRPCYLIYAERMRRLLMYLLTTPGIRVGIITSAGYTAQNILPYIERVYKLPAGVLQKCLYINAHNFGDAYTGKGFKLQQLRALRVFRKDEKVILLDDSSSHIDDAKMCGIDAVRATGYCITRTLDNNVVWEGPPNPDYLARLSNMVTDIVDAFKNSTLLPQPATLILPIPKFGI